ncbi:MAG: acetate--CoA ligase family protein [Hyphomicrobiales bacterium]|nr:acetate--CoA ligase family protein [Hyphomicrobiales bacterium]
MPVSPAADPVDELPLDSAGEQLQDQPLSMRIIIGLFVVIPFLAVLAAIPVAWGGWLSWTDVILFVVFWGITGLGVTVGYHRFFTHGSFKAPRAVKITLAVMGGLALEGSISQWVADHRKHHKFSDEANDPHSPWKYGTSKRALTKGFWHSHTGWLFDPKQTSIPQYAPDIAADPDLVLITRLFPILVVISLSSETRIPFKTPELKPVIAAQSKPIVFWSYTLPSNFARTGLAESGVVVLSGLTHVSVAMRRLVDHARFEPFEAIAKVMQVPSDLARHLTTPTLSEHDSKKLLQAAGVALPHEILVADRTALDAALGNVDFPLVMKIQSRDIPHKSEVGGVKLDITTIEEAAATYDALIENAQKHRPQAALQGVLVSQMAKTGVEIIVGTLLDDTFGPMVMVGLGGVTAELFKDVVYRQAPVSAQEAAMMLHGLKSAPLLNGFRGAAPADVAAAAALIAKVSQLAAQLKGEVAEIELNPVLVHPAGEGVTIVDALVVRKS